MESVAPVVGLDVRTADAQKTRRQAGFSYSCCPTIYSNMPPGGLAAGMDAAVFALCTSVMNSAR